LATDEIKGGQQVKGRQEKENTQHTKITKHTQAPRLWKEGRESTSNGRNGGKKAEKEGVLGLKRGSPTRAD
jgi:hypothetical protein